MTSPKRFPDRDEIAAVRTEAAELGPDGVAPTIRRIAGRVMARRGHGGVAFMDIVDRSGKIQLLFQEQYGIPDVDLGDILGVAGVPTKTKRGEPSLQVFEFYPLAKIRTPLPDTFHGLTDVEQRYRRRYLDLLMDEDSRALFELRARMVTAIRRALDEEGFLEVETPVLQPTYGGAFARPFTTVHNELGQALYLRIATELYLKRLIVGGLERVYELGKDFRNEGVSFKHNPEFTMLEWYEAYADYHDTMVRIESLVKRVATELGTTTVEFRNNTIDLTQEWTRIPFIDALGPYWTRNELELRNRLRDHGVDVGADRDWPQLIDHAFSHFVEPTLIQPTIVFDYPVELSPFARTKDDQPDLAERFEYFIGGIELGNAFTEINDADEQRDRFIAQMTQVEGEKFDQDYVEALSYGMPPTGGLGMGIDRLAMVLGGKDSIRDVILFPALRTQK